MVNIKAISPVIRKINIENFARNYAAPLKNKRMLKFQDKISKDALVLHLKAFSSPKMEGRGIGQKGEMLAREYIVEEFKKSGLEQFEQIGLKDYTHSFEIKNKYITKTIPYDEYLEGVIADPSNPSKIETANIIGLIKAKKPTNDYFLITAHYDHLGMTDDRKIFYPGADDNASSLSILLEIARNMKNTPPKKNVVFVALSCEEHYREGSKKLAELLVKSGIKDNIELVNLEMMGGVSGKTLDLWTGKSGRTENITEGIKDAASAVGIKIRTHKNNLKSDDEVFMNRNIPSVGLVWDFFSKKNHKYCHSPNDTAENINHDVFEKAAKTVSAICYNIANLRYKK